ncbi:E3 ubiquitin-protein ligase RNF4 isoform X2 [Syngnathus scovelli]|uniref:E3 ubiquitin-protein ligase RNF4 isoform X2 n=1 Tax=Syngnathus scovelli TaxID=161590 RepID=UPI0021106B6F|nr:RING finger protein 4 [Syngnathus scovelli]
MRDAIVSMSLSNRAGILVNLPFLTSHCCTFNVTVSLRQRPMSAFDVPTETVRLRSPRRAEVTKPRREPTPAVQRKRRRVENPIVSSNPKPCRANRAAHAHRRSNANSVANRRARPRGRSASGPPADAETIDVMDNQENGVEEVVDLTSETAEASHVVDLTNNDSVLLVDEGPQSRRNTTGESYVVSSDDDDDDTSPAVPRVDFLTSLRRQSSVRCTPGTISCPVCMDTYSEMVDSGRLVVSTKCGHVFCSQCLRDALRCSLTCPTCRKRLTPRQYHPLYI